MVTVLFNRETLAWSGTDRKPLLSEIPVHGIELEKFKKDITDLQTTVKKNGRGEPLYLLVSDNNQETKIVDEQVQTTERTDLPLLDKTTVKEQVRRKDGSVVRYKRKRIVKSTKKSDNPSMVTILSNQGNVKVHEKDSKGNLLYVHEEEYGKAITCYRDIKKEIQRKDSQGRPLYLKVTQVEKTTKLPPTFEEITRNDPRWNKDLYYATEKEEVLRSYTFHNNPEIFTYYDAVDYKIQEELDKSFSTNGVPLLQPISGYNSVISPFDGDLLLGEMSSVTYSVHLDVNEDSLINLITFSSETSIPARLRAVLIFSDGTEILSNSKNVISLNEDDLGKLIEDDGMVQVKVINFDHSEVRLQMPKLLY